MEKRNNSASGFSFYLPLAEYKEKSDLFDSDLFDAIDIRNCVRRRISFGGTGFDSVDTQLAFVKDFLASQNENN